jgi:tetratricopeptide (TPR) repeat protein
MWYYIIPLIIIAISLAFITYILVRKFRKYPSAVKDEVLVYPDFEDKDKEGNKAEGKHNISGHFFAFTEKMTRRMRVRLMKMENWLTNVTNSLHAKGLKKKNGDSDKTALTSLDNLNNKDEKFDEQYWIDILRSEPQSGYPYKKLGEIYAAREDFREARSVLRHAIRLDPNDKEALLKFEELKGKKTKKI